MAKAAEVPNRIVFGSREVELARLILKMAARRRRRVRPSEVLASPEVRQYARREVVRCMNKLLALHAVGRQK